MVDGPAPPARALDIGLVALSARTGDGAGRVMLELTRTLVARGHRVRLYARDFEGDGLVVPYTPLPSVGGPQIVSELVVFAAATAMLRRAEHDVVVMMGSIARPRPPFVVYGQFALAGWMATWSGDGRPSPYHRAHARVSRQLERSVVARASGVLACSRAVADELVGAERRAGSAPAVAVVPNGIALREFPLVDADARDRGRADLAVGDGRVIGFIGEYKTGRKGLDLLLDAVARGPGDEHLVIAGAGPTATVAQQTAALGLAGRVHQLGVVPARRVLDVADVVAVPSRYEPFSLVALEAAAAGLPVVLPATVGAADHLGDGAVLVPQLTGLGIRTALDRLRADPALAQRAGRAARRAAEQLDWSVTTAQAAAFVESLASSPGDARTA